MIVLKIETIATSAVQMSISKTDLLNPFINSGDKEPLWDGNIYIHQESFHTNKGIKKVSVQVKGKVVKSWNFSRIKYPIKIVDLDGYMRNGGTIYFVVYIDKITRTPQKIYYAELLPRKIYELKNKSSSEKSINIELIDFPEDNKRKTEIFLNFHAHSIKQTSFVNPKPATFESLIRQGVIDKLSFSYITVGNEISISNLPEIMDGKEMYLYAKIKGSDTLIPIEYMPQVNHVTIQENCIGIISVNGVEYYQNYSRLIQSNKVIISIGKSFQMYFSKHVNNSDNLSFISNIILHITFKGTLTQQINDINFILSMIENQSFSIDDICFPIVLEENQLREFDFASMKRSLQFYNKASLTLKSMNVKEELIIDKCTIDDLRNLKLVVDYIGNLKTTKDLKPNLPMLLPLKIGNLTLAILCIGQPNNGYILFDYFSYKMDVVIEDNNKNKHQVSQYSVLKSDNFLCLGNINYDKIIDNIVSIPDNDLALDRANNVMLEMLKAYDISHNNELFKAIKKMSNWLESKKECFPYPVIILNKLQVAARERPLNYGEKKLLHNLVQEYSEVLYQAAAFLLLNEQEEATKALQSFTKEELVAFKQLPIYKFRNEKI